MNRCIAAPSSSKSPVRLVSGTLMSVQLHPGMASGSKVCCSAPASNKAVGPLITLSESFARRQTAVYSRLLRHALIDHDFFRNVPIPRSSPPTSSTRVRVGPDLVSWGSASGTGWSALARGSYSRRRRSVVRSVTLLSRGVGWRRRGLHLTHTHLVPTAANACVCHQNKHV